MGDARLPRWRIDAVPTDKDPLRRILFVKAALSDVHALIRRFGAVCGRPKKERGGAEFNYSLFLHQISEAQLAEFRAELSGLAQEASAPAADAVPGAPAGAESEPSAGLEIPLIGAPPGGEAAEPGSSGDIPLIGAPAGQEAAPAVDASADPSGFAAMTLTPLPAAVVSLDAVEKARQRTTQLLEQISPNGQGGAAAAVDGQAQNA